jgi:hypothetical protein
MKFIFLADISHAPEMEAFRVFHQIAAESFQEYSS